MVSSIDVFKWPALVCQYWSLERKEDKSFHFNSKSLSNEAAFHFEGSFLFETSTELS